MTSGIVPLLSRLDRETKESKSNTYLTYYTYSSPQQTWYVNYPQGTSELINSYCEQLYYGDQSVMFLSEQVEDTAPIRAQITLSFRKSFELDKVFLSSLIYSLQEAVKTKYEGDDGDRCYLHTSLMKSEYKHQGNSVHLLILHMPFTRISIKAQSEIKSLFIEVLQSYNVKRYLQEEPGISWRDSISMVDEYKYIPMYGSTAHHHIPAPAYVGTYPELKSQDAVLDSIVLDVDDTFNPIDHAHFSSNVLDRNAIDFDRDGEYFFPLFFSLHFWSARLVEAKQASPAVMPIYSQELREVSEVLTRILRAGNLTALPEWESLWRCVTAVVNKLSTGTGAPLAIEFYNRATESGDGMDRVSKYWFECEENSLSINTLHWYASQYNPEEYNRWHMEHIVEAVNVAIDEGLTDYDVAKAIYIAYRLEYLNTDSSSSGWWQYKNHSWKQQCKGAALSERISSDFCRILRLMASTENMEGSRVIDREQQKRHDQRAGLIDKLKAKLTDNTKKKRIMNECGVLFRCEDFHKKVDNNPFLLLRNNGVHECIHEGKEAQLLFRPGKPEDWCIARSVVNFRTEYSWKHPAVRKYLDLVRKVFPDPELQTFHLLHTASYYIGRNQEKKLFINTGGAIGDNAKTTMSKIKGRAFAGYVVDVSNAILTDTKENMGSANPELSQAKNARLIRASEPNPGKSMAGANIKKWTSNDDYFVRGLYQNGGSQAATFKIELSCNTVPPMVHSDKQAMARIMVMPYLSRFIPEAPESEEEQYRTRTFPADPDFDRYVPMLGDAAAWVAAQYYPRYHREGLKMPPIVVEYILKYFEDTDDFLTFIKEYLDLRIPIGAKRPDEKSPVKEDDSVSAEELYMHFRDYWREKSKYEKSRMDIRTGMAKWLGEPRGSRYYGVKLKTAKLGMRNDAFSFE